MLPRQQTPFSQNSCHSHTNVAADTPRCCFTALLAVLAVPPFVAPLLVASPLACQQGWGQGGALQGRTGLCKMWSAPP